jgi:hypothetical protein
MQVIDSDGHLHEPFDLFERYMEKEFHSMRPRIVDLRDEARDTGRWLVEGRLVPRLPFTKGVGGGGFRYQTPRHEQMKAKDNSLDDIEGRLQDMDRMEIDFQIVYPTALVWAFDLENKELAAGRVPRLQQLYCRAMRQSAETFRRSRSGADSGSGRGGRGGPARRAKARA